MTSNEKEKAFGSTCLAKLTICGKTLRESVLSGEASFSPSMSNKVVRKLDLSFFSSSRLHQASYLKVLTHMEGIVSEKSQFDAAYHSREKMFQLLASVIAFPNYIYTRGSHLYFVGIFNHTVGWAESYGKEVPSNSLVVIADLESFRVESAYPFKFVKGNLP